MAAPRSLMRASVAVSAPVPPTPSTTISGTASAERPNSTSIVPEPIISQLSIALSSRRAPSPTQGLGFSKEKITFQSSFMLTTVQPLAFACSIRLSGNVPTSESGP